MNDELGELRAAIVSGLLRGSALRERLLSIPFRNRDMWLDAVLGFDPPPVDIPNLPRGAVPYLPCGVDEILTFVREVPVTAEDELVSPSHARLFAAACERAKVPVTLTVFPHGPHALGLAEGYPEVGVWPRQALAWLRGRGILGPGPGER